MVVNPLLVDTNSGFTIFPAQNVTNGIAVVYELFIVQALADS